MRYALFALLGAVLCCPSLSWAAQPHQSLPPASIVTVRVEKPNSPPDWKLVHPPVTKVKVGAAFSAAMYVTFQGVQPGSHALYQISILDPRGRPLFGKIVSTFSVPTSRYTFRYTSTDPGVSRAGTYRIVGTVTFAGRTLRKTTAFQAVSSLPPPARVIDFSVSQLKTVNDQGQISSSFAHDSAVSFAVNYDVRNVRGTATVIIEKTYQYMSPQGWRPLSHPNTDSFDTANGAHTYQASFTLAGFTGAIRIVLGITVGRRTVTRSTVIHIA